MTLACKERIICVLDVNAHVHGTQGRYRIQRNLMRFTSMDKIQEHCGFTVTQTGPTGSPSALTVGELARLVVNGHLVNDRVLDRLNNLEREP